MSVRWLEDLEERAQAALPPHVWRYFTTGALDGVSAREATAAWQALRFMPRVLRDVRRTETATTLLGTEVRAPVGDRADVAAEARRSRR